MNNALRLAETASWGLSALPFEVREAALDLIDELMTEARMRALPRQPSHDEVFELTVQSGGKQYVVRLVAQFDHRSRNVLIVSIGHVAKQ